MTDAKPEEREYIITCRFCDWISEPYWNAEIAERMRDEHVVTWHKKETAKLRMKIDYFRLLMVQMMELQTTPPSQLRRPAPVVSEEEMQRFEDSARAVDVRPAVPAPRRASRTRRN